MIDQYFLADTCNRQNFEVWYHVENETDLYIMNMDRPDIAPAGACFEYKETVQPLFYFIGA
jgi:hypothetical protein